MSSSAAVIVEAFTNTLSIDGALRQRATEMLTSLEHQPGFLVQLLECARAAQVEPRIRQACAIRFKNVVLQQWSEPSFAGLPPADRVTIKSRILVDMLQAEPRVQSQLLHALALIAQIDFPQEWPELMPLLVRSIDPINPVTMILGALRATHSIFYRYRHALATSELSQEVALVYENFTAPLTRLFAGTAQAVLQALGASAPGAPLAAADVHTLRLQLRVLHVAVENFYSLSVQDLPEQFEQTLREWFTPLIALLRVHNPLLSTRVVPGAASIDDEDEMGPLNALHSITCDVVTLYAQKYDEETAWSLPQFFECVLQRLTTVGDDVESDQLLIAAVRFLSEIARQPTAYTLFGAPTVLPLLCEKIILPQLRLRDSDLDHFADNPLEYIRRDLEHADSETRRGAATVLVRALLARFKVEITDMFSGFVRTCLAEYAKDPKQHWSFKDTAVYIILAVSADSSTVSRGITQVNPHVDVESFFHTQVLPELDASSSINSLPLLKADALKFVTAFRSQLPATALVSLLPLAVRLLGSSDYVVHTYTCHLIDRMLTVRETNGALRVSKDLLAPHVQSLLVALFTLLMSSDETKENEYILKAIVRVIAVSDDLMLAFMGDVVPRLTQVLEFVSQHPRNPNFNHFLFEALAALIGCIVKHDASKVGDLDQALLPTLFRTLSLESCAEFGPYIFQLLALMLELRRELPPAFVDVAASLLAPAVWENHGNIPAVIRLLRAYFAKGAREVCYGEAQLPALLGVFQKLLSLTKERKHAFHLLAVLFAHIPYAAPTGAKLQPFMTDVLRLCFKALQGNATMSWVTDCIVALSVFVRRNSAALLIQHITEVQSDLFAMFFLKVWAPVLGRTLAAADRKILLIATADVLAYRPYFDQPGHTHLVSAVGESVKSLIATHPAASAASASLATADEEAANTLEQLEEGNGALTTQYIPLSFATRPPVDHAPDVPQPNEYALNVLRSLPVALA